MSLEIALAENTAALKTMSDLMAKLLAGGVALPAPIAAPVEKVDKPVKGAAAKKPDPKSSPDTPSGEASTSAPEKESPATDAQTGAEPTEATMSWAEKTAAKYAELKDAEPTVDTLRLEVVAISTLVGRAHAEAALARFGAQALVPKPGKKPLGEDQYEAFHKYALQILGGFVDPTAAELPEGAE